jgi:hypothetical protein
VEPEQVQPHLLLLDHNFVARRHLNAAVIGGIRHGNRDAQLGLPNVLRVQQLAKSSCPPRRWPGALPRT